MFYLSDLDVVVLKNKKQSANKIQESVKNFCQSHFYGDRIFRVGGVLWKSKTLPLRFKTSK
jgi:hypothetical protein